MNFKSFVQKNSFFIGILIIGHLLAAIFSEGHFHWDEHYQILEFINYKFNNIKAADLPWEFHKQMRPWLGPFVYFYITKFFSLFQINSPFILTFIFRLISSLLGMASLWALYKYLKEKKLISQNQLFLGILALLWFLPFIHARISSEAVGGSVFLIAFCLFLEKKETNKAFIQLFIGLLFGFSFILRFHLLLSLGCLILWAYFISKVPLKNLFLLGLGILLSYLLSMLIDHWGYGSWTHPIISYVKENLFHDKASNWGVSPWYSYFKYLFNKGIFPIGLILIISYLFYWFKNPKSPFTAVTLPFFVAHSLIGHKELRFLFPLAGFAPYFIYYLYDQMKEKYSLKKWFILISVINTIIFSISIFRPANNYLGFYKSLRDLEKLPDNIYYLNDVNPFYLAQLKFNYYLPHPPQMIHLDKKEQFNSLKSSYFVFSSNFLDYEIQEQRGCQLIYANYPSYILKINLFNWKKRSKIWSLHKCLNEII